MKTLLGLLAGLPLGWAIKGWDYAPFVVVICAAAFGMWLATVFFATDFALRVYGSRER